MKKKIISSIIGYLLLANCYAQFSNTYWKVGRHVGLDFGSGNPVVNLSDNCISTVGNTSTSICNSRNQIIFYSNACRVYDRTDQAMPNGSNFNHGTISDTYINTDFYPPWKAAVIIPFPNDTNKFYLFYENLEWNVQGNYLPEKLYYLVVDKTLNGGLGDVVIKDQTVISGDTLSDGEVMAVKHGNGKDWWIVCRKYLSDKYFKVLVNSAGVQSPTIQHIGIPYTYSYADNGICNQTLNGTKMVFSSISGATSPYQPCQFDLFNFDRCSGSFYNYQQIFFPNSSDTLVLGACCFSPNGKYLYAHDGNKIWQFDLTVANIVDSKIYIGHSDSNNIMHMQIGVDNKIYVGPYGSANYIGVINKPDSLGIACDFQPYQIYCHGGGWWADGGIPNTPNFTLDAVAPCGVGIEEAQEENEKLQVYPNPCGNKLSVISHWFTANAKIEVFDLFGRKMNIPICSLNNENCQLNTVSLLTGVYFIKVADADGNVFNTKFVKE